MRSVFNLLIILKVFPGWNALRTWLGGDLCYFLWKWAGPLRGIISSLHLASHPRFSGLKPSTHQAVCGFFPASFHLPQNILLCLEPFPVSGMPSGFSWQLPNHNAISRLFLVSNGYRKCAEIKFQFWAHIQINLNRIQMEPYVCFRK